MNEKAEFAIKVLKRYALENHTTVRGTSDLSPMEQWLISRLFDVIKSLPEADEKDFAQWIHEIKSKQG